MWGGDVIIVTLSRLRDVFPLLKVSGVLKEIGDGDKGSQHAV